MATNQLALVSDAIPAHASQSGVGRGNEEVGANEVSTPRLKLLQKMSQEVDKHHANYVENAEPGMLINSITNKLYSYLLVINLKFKIEYIVWRDMQVGGGFLGNYETLSLANEAIAEQDHPDEWEARETHSHVLLLKDPDTGVLETTPVVMDFAVSKLRVSRDWNTQIATKGGDRFSSLWKISPVSVEKKGNQYHNIDITCLGWTTEDDYKAAEVLYEQFSA